MKSISLKLKTLYTEMSKSEKRIVDWIMQNPGKITSLSIVELSSQCGCSEATIVRFSKKLGLSGYQDLKISLASEGDTLPINSNISKDDSPFDIYMKNCTDIYLSLEKTKKSLAPDSLSSACRKISEANRIIVVGLGNSASIALDAAHKFLRAGLNAVAYTDNHMQIIAASHLTPADVVIAISHSGASKDIIDVLSLSKERNVTTIAITNKGESPILKYTDIPLFTSADETEYSILALNSRIAQLTIIDTIYHYIIIKNTENTLPAINEIERRLLTKKGGLSINFHGTSG